LLGGYRTQLPEIWRRAALRGVHDSQLRDLSCRLWEIGIGGMERLPRGYLEPAHVEATRVFLEHFTARGRVPGDDLLELNDDGPAQALRWASS
jgi:hypothetical protein